MLRLARTLHRETGSDNLCLAGGVALNCVGNGRILREGPFRGLWIQPAAGDAGGAVGAALLACHRLEGRARKTSPPEDAMKGGYLGPAFSNEEIERFLEGPGRSLRAAERRRPARSAVGRAGGREGHRLVPGTHGVRSARPRWPEHHRRCPQHEDAVGHEPQDQVSRVVPAVRALGAPRARGRLLRDGLRQPLHAAGGPGASRSAARR